MRRRHTDLTCRYRLGAEGNVPCRRDDVTRTVQRTRVIWQTACTRRGTGLGAVTGSTPARCSTIAVVMLTTDTLRHIAGHQTIATVVQIAVVTTSRWLGSPGDRYRLGCPMAGQGSGRTPDLHLRKQVQPAPPPDEQSDSEDEDWC